jgi:hypothetical protein
MREIKWKRADGHDVRTGSAAPVSISLKEVDVAKQQPTTADAAFSFCRPLFSDLILQPGRVMMGRLRFNKNRYVKLK